jgi:hypothetical protein
MQSTQDKQWALYLAKTDAQRRIVRDVRTPFENANVLPWIVRLGTCRTVVSVAKLRAEFEIADAR